MESILKSLWQGNVSPVDHYLLDNTETKHLVSLIEKNKQHLCQTISKEQIEILEKLLCCIDEYNLLTTEAAFCYGFSLGIKTIIESITIE